MPGWYSSQVAGVSQTSCLPVTLLWYVHKHTVLAELHAMHSLRLSCSFASLG